MLNVYAPTQDDYETEKEKFYEDLQKAYDKCTGLEYVVMLGDFNAKIGKEQYINEIAEKHTLHDTTSKNGERLCDFSAENNLYIARTKFPHKSEHKATWLLPENFMVIR